MHLLVRESRSLDAEAAAEDLGQSPAELLLLSFSDSDLGAAAAAWEAWPEQSRPGLRLVNLRRLRHPMSVDIYLERMLPAARCVIVRLLGGLEYWRYGVDELAAACRAQGIALALLPGDGRDDDALKALSTVGGADWDILSACLEQGGAVNLRRALTAAGRLGTEHGVVPLALPMAGSHPVASDEAGWGRAALVFYRSHLQSGDIAPVEALAAALAARGMAVRAFYVASLKDAGAALLVAEQLRAWRPQVVLNTTAFSARGDAGSPLDAADAPVLQAVLAGSARAEWAGSLRGLSGTDLAMHVVLPELDGRLLTTAISFKQESAAIAGLEFARTVHAPDADGIAFAAARAAGWARLAAAPAGARVIACVLSDYPGGGRVGHAVGLDTFASLSAMLGAMADGGYWVERVAAAALVDGLCAAEPDATLDLATYRTLFARLPGSVREPVLRAWGEPEQDPAVTGSAFRLRWLRAGNVVMAVQPDRGSALDRKAGYHDPDCPPRHAYVAFHLWLQALGAHAIVHVGAHGTLEWLPGKSVALSAACFPSALAGALPVIYPFVVNNPGEAAAAKRRLGAVTIGHLTPPLRPAGADAALELGLDEYAAADGMDPRRLALLKRDILQRASEGGLLDESGADPGWSDDDRLARLDAYLCDVKDARIRDGLHVFGQGAPGEMHGLLAALDGRFVEPGPAGAPSRGRNDVLPTGRNIYSVDPRVVPTPTAMRLAERTASALLQRHLQDHGEYPRTLVLNLWGSTTMRTGGEDLALALVLLGARPEWDPQSGRVTGFEVLPIALLERPRVDVTLRISGLFRDAFALQIALFDAVLRAVATRDEAADWNPLAGSEGVARIYGPAPGTYGSGVGALLESGRWAARGEIGAAYLASSNAAYGSGAGEFAARAGSADAFVQVQDHHETDLLEGMEWAGHAGGFASLAESLGGSAALYHADTGAPERPVVRSVGEEVVRMTRARAANPAWIAGQMRHGYRGAAEIARALDGVYAHAACLRTRLDRSFDLLWSATLGDPEVDAFLRRENPAARAGMAATFADARRRGLWHSRRNDVGDGA